jgi:L-asparagine transporter-like permease
MIHSLSLVQILYACISMTHYKSLILILLIYKYATSTHVISSFTIEKIFLGHHLMTRHISPLKNNSKNLKKSPHPTDTCISITYYKSLILILSIYKYATSTHVILSFPVKKIFLRHHLMAHHISLLKNNSKNSRKSPHPTDTCISITYYKSLILILSIYKYATSTHVISSFAIEKIFLGHHLMARHISPLKNNSKNSKKSPHPMSHFSSEK